MTDEDPRTAEFASQRQAPQDDAAAAASRLDPRTMQAEAAARIADQIDTVANRIRTSDIDTIVDDVSGFARRNPLLFIGAAAALGFAASRFLKAQPLAQADPAQGDPWNVNSAPTSSQDRDKHHA